MGYGSTTIIATTKDGAKAASCQIKVNAPIKYVLNGGTNNISNGGLFNGSSIALLSPKRKGYTFGGWYTDSALKNKITSITSASQLTVYAKWTKVSVGKGKKPTLKNNKKRKLSIKYKKVSGAKGYQITVATNKKFTKSKKSYTVKSLKKTLTKRKKGTTYYVKVRAYKIDSTGAKVYGKYSKVKKIKIKK